MLKKEQVKGSDDIMPGYKAFSKEQIALANSVDLVDYLRANGEELMKSGREYRWQRYTSVTIRGNRWFKFKTQEGGYPIKFLEEFYGYHYTEAVELLLSYANDQGIYVKDQEQEVKEERPFVLPDRNSDMKRAYAYLTKTRLVDNDILKVFIDQGLIYEDEKYHNVVFVGRDENDVARHAHKKSTFSKNSYRGNVESSDPRYSFHFIGMDEKLYVFEAPIDMLSYISLNKEDWQQHSYVALCGLGLQAMEHLLSSHSNLQHIIIGTDHDTAGIEGAERIKDHLKKIGYEKISVTQPLNKDFNEDLKAAHGIKVNPGEDHPDYARLQKIIEEMKQQMITRMVTEKDLSKAFTDMYYELNFDKNDHVKLKEQFLKITEYAVTLEFNQILENVPFDSNDKEIDYLIEDYRAYKDKGNFEKRIKTLKKAFQDVRIASKEGKAKDVLCKAYRSLANESFMMVMECDRQIEHDIEMQAHDINVKKRPQAEIIGANGNVFNMMAIATKSLMTAGMEKEAKEMFDRITHSSSHEEALQIMEEYIEPVEVRQQPGIGQQLG